jgi:predicted small lipoprotein YifL
MRMRPAITSAALLALAVAACGGPGPVELSSAWPSKTGDFEDVNEKWTRHGRDNSGLGGEERHRLEQTIDVYATFKSPEWRAAWIARQAERHHLSQAAVRELTDKAKAEDAENYEVALLVATHDRQSNDLQKGKRSSWRVALVDQGGTEIVASEIKRDRRARVELESQYPHMGDFHEPYVARFPRSVDLLRPEARRFLLKVTSEQGGVVLEWREN